MKAEIIKTPEFDEYIKLTPETDAEHELLDKISLFDGKEIHPALSLYAEGEERWAILRQNIPAERSPE